VYGPVCTVVWEGRSREAPPYPDPWHETDMTGLVGDVRSRGLNGSGVSGPSGPFLTHSGHRELDGHAPVLTHRLAPLLPFGPERPKRWLEIST
jgi:hypothetical protein